MFDDIAGDNRSTEPSNGPVYGRKQNSTSGRRAAGALWIKEVTSHIQRHIVKLLNLWANATIPLVKCLKPGTLPESRQEMFQKMAVPCHILVFLSFF